MIEAIKKQYFLILSIQLLVTIVSLAQPSINSPTICHDQHNRVKCFDDGLYHIEFLNHQFSKLNKKDSSISFVEDGRKLNIYNRKLNARPVSIHLANKNVTISFGDSTIQLPQNEPETIHLNGIELRYDTLNTMASEIAFEIDDTTVKLEFWFLKKTNRIFWSTLAITDKTSSFYIKYNPFLYRGPMYISNQDSSIKSGWTISGSFRTRKYVWRIESSYMWEEKNMSYGSFGEAYEFEYNRMGKIRKRKSHGLIEHCTCN